MAMSGPTYDAEYEANLRRVIREELEAERRQTDSERRARWDWFWWAASLVVFGPFALAAAALLWTAAFALDLGAKLIWAVRRRGAEPAADGGTDSNT
jgi:fatty acid desaturase